jgi:hypothetical protein
MRGLNMMRNNGFRMMGNGQGGGIMAGIGAVFMIIFFLVVLTDLVFLGLALWKYISKN